MATLGEEKNAMIARILSNSPRFVLYHNLTGPVAHATYQLSRYIFSCVNGQEAISVDIGQRPQN